MKRLIICAAALSICTAAIADEGMWMVNTISRALVQKMEKDGLQLSSNEIYDADKVSLKDAIVSLDFGCSGSMVSQRGLLITNHHCAYSDVHSISTPEHNYLEDGFWAREDKEEIYIPGKSVYFLEKVLDVTEEVNTLIAKEKADGRNAGMRRLSHLVEKKYKAETGLDASLSSMWAGSKYYLALYKVYTDIRLVAAPPVSIAAFGGDIDNWEWPQHKCDFAMYRIYAAPDGSPAAHSDANVPLKPKRTLPISTAGLDYGDFAMVMGYPGKTDRYMSSAKLSYQQELELPITNSIRKEQMEIISSWMNKDPEIRLKYADKYFSLSNVQELQEGEVICYSRFHTVKEKKKDEKILKGSDNKTLLRNLDEKYKVYREPRRNFLYYRESIIRGSKIALIATRLKNNHKHFKYEDEYAGIDLRVEKDLFRNTLKTFFSNVDESMWGPFQKELFAKYGKDYDSMCEALWIDRWMTADDGIFKFLTDNQIRDFNKAVDDAQGKPSVSELNRQYTRAMYEAREADGILQYPDANSTMRLTYGTVGTFRRDGRKLPWQTLSSEILSKEDTSVYDFTLKPDWRELLKGTSVPVDFITDCDITGGNSGSAVMNSRGELVGLAFDGNKESLASDASFTKKYNKCVCADIRFVLWTLKNYARMDRILNEMEIR